MIPIELKGIVLPITFLIMDPCGLIGLDILVHLDSVTDYKLQMITFNFEDNVLSTELYSKEEIEIRTVLNLPMNLYLNLQKIIYMNILKVVLPLSMM